MLYIRHHFEQYLVTLQYDVHNMVRDLIVVGDLRLRDRPWEPTIGERYQLLSL